MFEGELLSEMLNAAWDTGSAEGSNRSDDQYDHLIFQQFTGLYDKDGIEIYEGDLIKISDTEFRKRGVHQVHYFKDCFVSSSVLFSNLEKANKDTLSWSIKKNIEVIGNIYETKEAFAKEVL